MKKTSKLFGAVALSAALAMGTVAPAFAADNAVTKTDDTTKVSTENTTTDVKDGAAATSYINVVTTIDQLNVSVPLHMTVAASVAGGLTTPSAGAYTIKNHSTIPVKVDNIKAVQNDANWDLVMQTGIVGDDAPATKIGKINLVAKAGSDAADKVMLAQCTTGIGITPSAAWSIDGVTGSAKEVALPIDWSESESSKLRGVYNGTDSVSLDAFTVQYTIAKNTNFTGNGHVES